MTVQHQTSSQQSATDDDSGINDIQCLGSLATKLFNN
jgi:hypothetical protein